MTPVSTPQDRVPMIEVRIERQSRTYVMSPTSAQSKRRLMIAQARLSLPETGEVSVSKEPAMMSAIGGRAAHDLEQGRAVTKRISHDVYQSWMSPELKESYNNPAPWPPVATPSTEDE